MEHRAIASEAHGVVSDIDERKGEILCEIPFFVTDSYSTQFTPSSFADSFKRAETSGRMFPLLWQHRMDDPIGAVTRHQVTSRAAELTARLSPMDAVPSAKRAYAQLMAGHVGDVSFGFTTEHSTPHKELRGVKLLDRVDFKELSCVTIGSVPGARVLSVRSSQVDDEPWTVNDVREELRDGMAVLWRAGQMTQWDVAQKLGVSRLKVEAWERGEVDDFVGLAAAEYTKLWRKWDVA